MGKSHCRVSGVDQTVVSSLNIPIHTPKLLPKQWRACMSHTAPRQKCFLASTRKASDKTKGPTDALPANKTSVRLGVAPGCPSTRRDPVRSPGLTANQKGESCSTYRQGLFGRAGSGTIFRGGQQNNLGLEQSEVRELREVSFGYGWNEED